MTNLEILKKEDGIQSEKDYAKELVFYFEMQSAEQMTHLNAKECALKVIEEIEKTQAIFHNTSACAEESYEYLDNVKKEIELL